MQDGITPLYIASQEGHTSVVSLLLDKGSAVDLPDKVRMISQAKLKPCIHYFDKINYFESPDCNILMIVSVALCVTI